MSRLIQVFTGRTVILLGLSWGGSIIDELFTPSGRFHPYQLDKSISNFRGVSCTFFLFYSIFNKNSCNTPRKGSTYTPLVYYRKSIRPVSADQLTCINLRRIGLLSSMWVYMFISILAVNWRMLYAVAMNMDHTDTWKKNEDLFRYYIPHIKMKVSKQCVMTIYVMQPYPSFFNRNVSLRHKMPF